MTKVLERGRRMRRGECGDRGRAALGLDSRGRLSLRDRLLLGLLFFAPALGWGQTPAPAEKCPQTTNALYARIRSIALDPQRVYHVRDASIDRSNLHIDLDDGTLAFTEDICGRITGAFFDGEGEIRLRPPNRVERASLALFTGMAILEEQFTSGYLRFNDDTEAVLERSLSPASEYEEFLKQATEAGQRLADGDALRLMQDFSQFLPVVGSNAKSNGNDRQFPRFLHVHLLGKKLGAFEVFWDATASEPLSAGQPRLKDGVLFFDTWTSFAPSAIVAGTSAPVTPNVTITNFRIKASVQPPRRLQASTEMSIQINAGGERMLLFELSRFLKVDAVEAEGHAVDFIQNPAIEGSQLQRRGNDLIAVIFPSPLVAGHEVKLRFTYAGDVLSDAGDGLLYVGERGRWYPSFGLSPAQFDMEFRYPEGWTLVATGKPLAREKKSSASEELGADQVSRWISERPIPVAGFNLGKFVRADARVANILVEAYGTKGVEKSFPKAPPEILEQPSVPNSPRLIPRPPPGPMLVAPAAPSPARDAQAVADRAARAIQSFSQWFGPYPYGSLALTQMPGQLSQGWPGLVFLSSYAFLSPQEQSDLHLDAVTRDLDNQVLVHETAHQWWGDYVLWKSYRDQWIAEGLANYASLMLLEEKNPAGFRAILEKYRRNLLHQNEDGESIRDAGPVTLGQRLESSHFPDGYEAISYERGTWLFHMLRSMLRDAETGSHSRKGHANADEPFFRGLRKIREQYAGKSVSTEELIHVFEEELPRSLWFENRRKLDWFLEGWIQGTAIPELELQDVRLAEKNGGTAVSGTIVQKGAPEDLVTAVPVYGSTASNGLVFLGQVLADGDETPFRLTGPANLKKIVLDPRQTILSGLK